MNGLYGSDLLVSNSSDLMSKCSDSLEHWNRQGVAAKVVETVVAGLLILMMAA
jgi:hypothetical protein